MNCGTLLMTDCLKRWPGRGGGSGADTSLIPWPGAVVVEATDTPEGLGPVIVPLRMRAKTRIGNYLVTLEANKGILLLQPFKRDISLKNILCMKCHMGLPH